ncbi:MAG: response regulator [Patescibacteria group bacterium]
MAKQKILVIEDENSLRRALVEKLNHSGYTPIEAKDGQAGLALALKEYPDLILLDIVMPVMDGLTMLDKLRKNSWGRDVPVILLTNLNESKDIAEAIKNGAYDYLVKSDWKLEDVITVIRQHLK